MAAPAAIPASRPTATVPISSSKGSLTTSNCWAPAGPGPGSSAAAKAGGKEEKAEEEEEERRMRKGEEDEDEERKGGWGA